MVSYPPRNESPDESPENLAPHSLSTGEAIAVLRILDQNLLNKETIVLKVAASDYV